MLSKREKSKLLCIVFVVFLSGCQRDSNVAKFNDEPSRKVEFDFMATVDFGSSNKFTVQIGNKINGSFSYDVDIPDASAYDSVGVYPQTTNLVGLEFQLNEIHFKSEISEDSDYSITILNDSDWEADILRDIFELSCRAPQLAGKLKVDDVQAHIIMQDLTTKAFSNAFLPVEIDFDHFKESAYLFFNGTNIEGNSSAAVWGIRAKIDSLVRKP